MAKDLIKSKFLTAKDKKKKLIEKWEESRYIWLLYQSLYSVLCVISSECPCQWRQQRSLDKLRWKRIVKNKIFSLIHTQCNFYLSYLGFNLAIVPGSKLTALTINVIGSTCNLRQLPLPVSFPCVFRCFRDDGSIWTTHSAAGNSFHVKSGFLGGMVILICWPISVGDKIIAVKYCLFCESLLQVSISIYDVSLCAAGGFGESGEARWGRVGRELLLLICLLVLPVSRKE